MQFTRHRMRDKQRSSSSYQNIELSDSYRCSSLIYLGIVYGDRVIVYRSYLKRIVKYRSRTGEIIPEMGSGKHTKDEQHSNSSTLPVCNQR